MPLLRKCRHERFAEDRREDQAFGAPAPVLDEQPVAGQSGRRTISAHVGRSA